MVSEEGGKTIAKKFSEEMNKAVKNVQGMQVKSVGDSYFGSPLGPDIEYKYQSNPADYEESDMLAKQNSKPLKTYDVLVRLAEERTEAIEVRAHLMKIEGEWTYFVNEFEPGLVATFSSMNMISAMVRDEDHA